MGKITNFVKEKITGILLKYIPRDKRIVNRIIQNDSSRYLGNYEQNYTNLAREGYMLNDISYGAIKMIASTISQFKYKVSTMNSNGEKEYISDHPWLKLIQRPNDFQGQSEYLTEVISFWLISGKTFQQALFAPSTGEPKKLYTMRPDYVYAKFNSNKTKIVLGYNQDGNIIPFKEKELSYLKFFHPLNELDGLSPLVPAAYSVDMNSQAKIWNVNSFQNNAMPSGYLKTKETVGEDNQERYKEMLKSIKGSLNSRKPFVADNGDEWVQLGLNALEMDFINGLNISAKGIAIAFGIPSVLLGDSDSSTYNNYKEAEKAFTVKTALAISQMIVDEWNNWLMPIYGDENAKIEVDPKSILILQEEKNNIVERTIKLYNSGVITRAEARQMNGFTFSDEDEIYKVLGNVVFLPQEKDDVKTLETKGNKYDSLMKKFDLVDQMLKKKAIKQGDTITNEEIEEILDSLDFEEFYSSVLPGYIALIEIEGQRVVEDILDSDQAFVFTEEVNEYLEKNVLRNSKVIVDETLRGKVGNIIQDYIGVGQLNVAGLKKDIQKLFEQQYFISDVPNHLDMIARTEIGTAFSVTNNATYEQNDVPFKEWIPTTDERTRESHKVFAPSTVIAFEEEFTTGLGNEALYPRDPQLPVEDIVQCRCGYAPAFEEGKSAYPDNTKQEFWESQMEALDSYYNDFREIFDEAFKKQAKNIAEKINDLF